MWRTFKHTIFWPLLPLKGNTHQMLSDSKTQTHASHTLSLAHTQLTFKQCSSVLVGVLETEAVMRPKLCRCGAEPPAFCMPIQWIQVFKFLAPLFFHLKAKKICPTSADDTFSSATCIRNLIFAWACFPCRFKHCTPHSLNYRKEKKTHTFS